MNESADGAPSRVIVAWFTAIIFDRLEQLKCHGKLWDQQQYWSFIAIIGYIPMTYEAIIAVSSCRSTK